MSPSVQLSFFIIEDVLIDPDFAPHRAIATSAGYRAVQSTPLFSRSGEPLGMVSTHFRRPHRPLERELRLTDLYAWQAAEMIERKHAEEALRVSEEPFRRYFDLGLIGMAITSPVKGCLEVNDELCRILGYERSELLQKAWTEMTHLDDLAADVASKDEVRSALTDIVSDANRASTIIARIRALTKRSAREKTSLQLSEVIAEVLVLAHRELAERGIEVRTELPKNLPRVSGDCVQLQQVFLNLIINSLEAMSAVEEDRRVLTIRGQRDQLHGRPAVRISVQDLGRGIAPADMAHLFEAFYTTKPDGMGMGLRIGASIVEALGGRLWVTPNAGPGVTFSCALPTEAPRTP
jgi:signal transduction histidine kinase